MPMPLSFGPRSYSGSASCVSAASPICFRVGKPPVFFAPLPMSLAYSSSAPWTWALGSVARCQIPRNSTRNTADKAAARRARAFIGAGSRSCSGHRLFDGETVEVLVGLGRVELLAHDLELRVAGRRRLH